jgi:hypothetical protein
MKSEPGPPMTLGGAAAARVRFIVWCLECRYQVEPASASLRDPTVAKPGREIFRADAVPWVEVHGEIPRFAKRAG